jgi:hypothetical protein
MKTRSSMGIASMILIGLMGATVLIFEGRGWFESAGLMEKDPVLVFVIPSIENARRVRSAVSAERVHWEGQPGLAIVDGRVVALSLDDAAEVVEKAGWVDRPIQIVRLDDPRHEPGDGSPEDLASREARANRLRELVHKPMLSRGEQMFVLAAMNDGIEL